MKLQVHSTSGAETGRSVELSESVFGIEPNEHAVYLAVKQYLAAQRQGTHKAKERGEIAGSTRKIKKQKGTGTARAGSIKNPLFRHGGRIFGPRPRKYEVKLNKKVKNLARRSALSAKAAAGEIVVVEDFSFEAPKTKSMQNLVSALKADQGRSLVVIGQPDENIFLSGRNMSHTEVTPAAELNPYHILKAGTVVLSESALSQINEKF